MNLMPNKVFKEEELKRTIFYQKVNSGTEAIICASNKDETVYKIFIHNGKIIEMSDNKVKKILKIYNMNLENSVKPLNTISLGNKIVGYEMSCNWDYKTYKSYELSINERIEFLKRIKDILEYFYNNGIIYGDLSMRNILINRNNFDIMFCDMDNIQIENLPIDLYSSDLLYYIKSRGIDENLHAYLHNLMTLRFFDLDLFCSNKMEILKRFKFETIRIMEKMKKIEQFNGEYIVSHIRTN